MIIVGSDRCRLQPSSSLAFVGSATSTEGSPERRDALCTATGRPVTSRTTSITCRTDTPRPVPRLTTMVSPWSSRCSIDVTSASGDQDTVTYGAFRPDARGNEYHDLKIIRRDEAGFCSCVWPPANTTSRAPYWPRWLGNGQFVQGSRHESLGLQLEFQQRIFLQPTGSL
jgi:hypothetical protein